MNKIPSLQLLCSLKFPFDEVVKDKRELVQFLSYPPYITAEIISNKHTYKVTNIKERCYAVDRNFSYYFVIKDTIIISDDMGNEYIQKARYLKYYNYLCDYTNCTFKPILPMFNNSRLCYHCHSYVYPRSQEERDDSYIKHALADRAFYHVKHKLESDFTRKDILYKKNFNGLDLFIFTKDYAQELQILSKSIKQQYSDPTGIENINAD